MGLNYFFGRVGWVGGVEKLILKLTSASTGVGVEAWAELGNKTFLFSIQESCNMMLRLTHFTKYVKTRPGSKVLSLERL